MMKIVNIYYIFDSSTKIRGKAKNQIEENISRITRALEFSHCKTKLHLIGYRDRSFISKPFERISAYGNPNLGEGLKLLDNILAYEKKHGGMWGKSIFILHSSGAVLEGWKKPLEKLYKNKDFALGLRYVVQHGKPDKEASQAFFKFTESSDKILHHFGESRLVSLVENIERREGKKCYTFST